MTRTATEDEELEATPEQVAAAIKALSAAELLRLTKFAKFRVRGLGHAALGRDYQDLLQEALMRGMSVRRWKPGKVDFVRFVIGAMRSTSNAWKTKANRSGGREVLCDDRPTSENEASPLAGAESSAPSPDRRTMARAQVEEIEKRFESDPQVSEVIAGLAVGMSGPEIMEAAKMTENEYRAAVKRMRRAVVRGEGS